MKRAVFTIGFLLTTLCALPTSGANTKYGQHIQDAKYAISFNLPMSWTHPTVTTSTSGITKLEVQDQFSPSSVGLVQVEVVSGRHTNATEIADGIRTSATPGITVAILSSTVGKFSVGKTEQLKFDLQEKQITIYGTVEAFFRSGKTYTVASDSQSISISNRALFDVMATWGK